MKKIISLWIIICVYSFAKANPIACPPVISELYIVDNSHWYLELVFIKGSCYQGITTLDGIQIATSAGTVGFKNGIHITNDSVLVITQDSLLSPVQLNRAGDFIIIKNSKGNQIDKLYFGNIASSQISAPAQGQSIVTYRFVCWGIVSGNLETIFPKVKDNHPTIGFNAFKPYDASSANTIGTFSGIVYDLTHHPVPGVHIGNQYFYAPNSYCENFFDNIMSDADGKFSIPQYSGKYGIHVFLQTARVSPNPIVDIEPGAMNYYEFTIDTTLTGIQSNSVQKKIDLKCFPNPSSGETTISFTMPSNKPYTAALVKIYNSVSEVICILPVTIADAQRNYTVKWNGMYLNTPVVSGNYYCNLELDGQSVATNKIIIAK
jgi:hypothetical protein